MARLNQLIVIRENLISTGLYTTAPTPDIVGAPYAFLLPRYILYFIYEKGCILRQDICLIFLHVLTKRGNKMKILKTATMLLASTVLSYSALAAESNRTVIGDVEMPEVQNSKAFDEIKKRLGKWEGKMTQYLTGDVFDVSYEWKLTSGGNTIAETIIEDGVEMLTTYSDKDGELVIKHYCALGTEPIFKVSQASGNVLAIELDNRSDFNPEVQSFVTDMKWTTDPANPNTMIFENSVHLDGELTNNRAELRKIN